MINSKYHRSPWNLRQFQWRFGLDRNDRSQCRTIQQWHYTYSTVSACSFCRLLSIISTRRVQTTRHCCSPYSNHSSHHQPSRCSRSGCSNNATHGRFRSGRRNGDHNCASTSGTPDGRCGPTTHGLCFSSVEPCEAPSTHCWIRTAGGNHPEIQGTHRTRTLPAHTIHHRHRHISPAFRSRACCSRHPDQKRRRPRCKPAWLTEIWSISLSASRLDGRR